MELVNLTSVSINQTPMDWKGNASRIIRAMTTAYEEHNSQVIVFPELCVSGYGCEDSFFSKKLLDKSWESLEAIALETRFMYGAIVCVGIAVLVENSVYNCVAVIGSGKVRGIVPKRCLANSGVHYERRWFTPGRRDHITTIKDNIPFGDLVFEFLGVKFGFEICEDGWNYRRPGIDLFERGVNLILNPSASHFSVGKHGLRKQFVLEGTRAYNCAYVYSNLLGCESGRIIYDGGSFIANNGRIVKEAPRFSFEEFELVSAVVDVEANRFTRAQNANTITLDYPVVRIKDDGLISRLPVVPELNSQEYEMLNKYEEISSSVALGMFDYLKKTGTNGYVVSLSGGADSSCVAMLVYGMIERVVYHLGKDKFLELCPQFKDTDFEFSTKGLSELLLTCLYQGTENSSDTTFNSAKTLCTEIGVPFKSIDVNSIFLEYQKLLEESFGFKFSWEEHDIALQNLQARVRSPGVWSIANIKNALLLTTSNRSESAVGYASMDGDTSGGLAPIAGLSKITILEWLQYQQKQYFPWLEAVTNQKPTAELRPEEQEDEIDLMPYEILNFIEEQAFLYRRDPQDILDLLAVTYTEHTRQTHIEFTRKFFKLWSINQWKRERYAPAFHLDDRSLDPKTWCRFPILNSKFKEELEELH